MFPVELLIEPLRVLLTALGTGILPPDNPADRVRTTNARLETIRGRSRTATAEVTDSWRGAGADAVSRAADATDRRTHALTLDGDEFSSTVESAARTVKAGATEIETLLNSFERAAKSLGPQLYSPIGLTMITPIAIDHVTRGLQVIGHTQSQLHTDTAKVMSLARHLTPATVAPAHGRAPDDPRPENQGRFPITLPNGSTVYAPNERAAKAVRAALSQRGVRYHWGGTSPETGFDCSGLTQWAYRQAGLDLPRLAQDQDTAGFPVTRTQLQPGDLAVWSGHVAMYVGDDLLIEAGSPVQLSPVRTTNQNDVFEGFYRPR